MAGLDLDTYPFFSVDAALELIPPAPTPLQHLVHDSSLSSSSDDRSQGSEEDDLAEVTAMSTEKGRSNSAAAAAAAKKVRAACSNCRASHVACSHEVPCRRCVEHGIGDSCKYLPRKKRTNFKKRKQGDGKDDVEETYADNTRQPLPPVSATSYNPLSSCDKPDASTAAAAVSTTTPSTYVPNIFDAMAGGAGAGLGFKQGAQDPSLLPFTQLLGDFPSSLSLLGASNAISPSSINSSIQLLENILNDTNGSNAASTVPDVSEESSWLSQVISDPSEPSLSLGSSSSSPLSFSPPSSPSDLSKSWALTTPAAGSSGRALHLLQEMKSKNERLERLLSIALNDIKELKKQQVVSEQATKQLQLFKLHNLSASGDFNQRGMPAIAMFSLSGVRHGEILQCNEAFRNLVGYGWEDLMKAGFTCCKLFPERFKIKLGKDYQAIMAGEVSSGQDDLAILRGDSREVPVRAFYHIIFNDMGVPLYKMFYAFPL